MKKKQFNLLASCLGAADSCVSLPGEEKEVDHTDHEAFYFLTVLFVMIVTIFIFNDEIMRLLF